LNATVEAARAGEVGAGFAVGANEVQELAKQTATANISPKIEAIQSDAKGAVTAIKSIREVIGQVNDISRTIASAVEEQSATTSEMSRNISEAARGGRWRRTFKGGPGRREHLARCREFTEGREEPRANVDRASRAGRHGSNWRTGRGSEPPH